MATKEKSQEVIKKINELAKEVEETIAKMDNPKVQIPLRGLSNVYFDEVEKMIKLGDKQQTRTFFNVGQAR